MVVILIRCHARVTKGYSALERKNVTVIRPQGEEKFSRSQALTGAKETLRAIVDSCPLGRASVDRLRHTTSCPRPSSWTHPCVLSFLLSFSRYHVRPAKDRSRKITSFIAVLSDWSVCIEIFSILFMRIEKIVLKNHHLIHIETAT